MKKLENVLKKAKVVFVAICFALHSWIIKGWKWFVAHDTPLYVVYDIVLWGGGVFGFTLFILTRGAPAGTVITATAPLHAYAFLIALVFGAIVATATICFDLKYKEKDDSQ